MLRAAMIAMALAGSAAAEEQAVDGDAFRAYAEGWTLHFEEDGQPFGAERYLPGDEVIWKPEGGDCMAGVWREVGGAICFLYADAMSCWRVFRDDAGLLARPADGDGPDLRIARRDRAPLLCPETPAV